MPRNYKYYNPLKFNVNAYSPALWLDAADRSTLIMDGARTFNGSSQYLYVLNNSTLQNSGALWLSCWVKLNSVVANKIIANKWGGTPEYALTVNSGSSKFAFTVRDSGNTTNFTAEGILPSTGQWYFVIAYCDVANNVVGISVNGSAFTTGACSSAGVSSTSFVVGAYSSGASGFIDGTIDSLCIGKPTSGWLPTNATALRDYLYNGGSGRRSSDFLTSGWYTGSNPSGVVSWWDMDARSGNESDRIGSNNLTDNGGVGYATGIASGLVQYNGDPITRWQDKSGNARHATAPSDAARPVYATGVQNGLSAILYDALDDKLDLASSLTLTDQTIFAVVKLASTVTAATSAKALLSVVSGDACGIIYGAGTGTLTNERLWWYRVYLANVYGKGQCAADIPAGGYVHSFSYTNAAPLAEIWQNGVAQTLVATSSGEANSTRPYTGYQRIGSAFNDHICELIILPSVIAASDVAKFHRYLGNKWGITVP